MSQAFVLSPSAANRQRLLDILEIFTWTLVQKGYPVSTSPPLGTREYQTAYRRFVEFSVELFLRHPMPSEGRWTDEETALFVVLRGLGTNNVSLKLQESAPGFLWVEMEHDDFEADASLLPHYQGTVLAQILETAKVEEDASKPDPDVSLHPDEHFLPTQVLEAVLVYLGNVLPHLPK